MPTTHVNRMNMGGLAMGALVGALASRLRRGGRPAAAAGCAAIATASSSAAAAAARKRALLMAGVRLRTLGRLGGTAIGLARGAGEAEWGWAAVGGSRRGRGGEGMELCRRVCSVERCGRQARQQGLSNCPRAADCTQLVVRPPRQVLRLGPHCVIPHAARCATRLHRAPSCPAACCSSGAGGGVGWPPPLRVGGEFELCNGPMGLACDCQAEQGPLKSCREHRRQAGEAAATPAGR